LPQAAEKKPQRISSFDLILNEVLDEYPNNAIKIHYKDGFNWRADPLAIFEFFGE